MSLLAIESLLQKKIGLDPQVMGSRKIARAVENRCKSLGLLKVESYLEQLQNSAEELAELIELIVVPETWFFRDRQPFQFLINHTRSQWLSKRSRLRLLSVPCASGEEPYSIAMSLLEAGLSPDRFKIDAIDISRRAIAKAQRAFYRKNAFRGEDFISKTRYFQETEEGYTVLPFVQNTIKFRQENILEAFPTVQTQYDVIFCRNLLIYLPGEICDRILNLLTQLLLPQGLLFVGSSETAKVASFVPSSESLAPLISVHQSFTFAYQKQPKLPVQSSLKPPSHSTAQPVKFPIPTQAKSTVTLIAELPKQALNLTQIQRLADQGETTIAIEQCQQYLECDRTSAPAYTLLGTLYQAQTDNSLAEKCFQKALYLDPNFDQALIHLALLKEHRGDFTGANILKQRLQKLQKKSSNSL